MTGTPLHCARCGCYGILVDNGRTPKAVVAGEWPCLKCKSPMRRSFDPDLAVNELPWHWASVCYAASQAVRN